MSIVAQFEPTVSFRHLSAVRKFATCLRFIIVKQTVARWPLDPTSNRPRNDLQKTRVNIRTGDQYRSWILTQWQATSLSAFGQSLEITSAPCRFAQIRQRASTPGVDAANVLGVGC